VATALEGLGRVAHDDNNSKDLPADLSNTPPTAMDASFTERKMAKLLFATIITKRIVNRNY